MAKRRKRRRSRKSRVNPRKRKRSHARKRRSNPRRRRSSHRRRRYRVARANPRRARSAPRRRRRRSHGNPRRRRSHRRSRRNPNLPLWAKAGIAAVLAVAGYAVVSAGAFAVTQRTDPSLATTARNRYIAAGAVALGGLALATMGGLPLFGVALLASAAVAAVGTPAALKLGEVLQPKQLSGLGAVMNVLNGQQRMNGYQRIGAVYGNNMGSMLPQFTQMGGYQRLGAVYANNMGSINGGRGWTPSPPFGFQSPV